MYVFYAIAITLSFFGLISFRFPFVANFFALFDIFIVLGVKLIMINYGAAINEQFVDHKVQLVKYKETLTFIKLNLEQVISDTIYTGTSLRMYQRVFQSIAKDCSDNNQIKAYIDDLLCQLDMIIQRLEIEQVYHPLKLMGVPPSYGLLKSVITTLLTIAVAVAQKLVQSQ